MGYVYGQGSTDPAWDAADARRRKQRKTAGLGQALQHLSGLWLQHQLGMKQQEHAHGLALDLEQQKRADWPSLGSLLGMAPGAAPGMQGPTPGGETLDQQPTGGLAELFGGMNADLGTRIDPREWSTMLRQLAVGGESAEHRRDLEGELHRNRLDLAEIRGGQQRQQQQAGFNYGLARDARKVELGQPKQQALEADKKATHERQAQTELRHIIRAVSPFPWASFGAEPEFSQAASDSVTAGVSPIAAPAAVRRGLFGRLAEAGDGTIELPDRGKVKLSDIHEDEDKGNRDLYAGKRRKKKLSLRDIQALFDWFVKQSEQDVGGSAEDTADDDVIVNAFRRLYPNIGQ